MELCVHEIKHIFGVLLGKVSCKEIRNKMLQMLVELLKETSEKYSELEEDIIMNFNLIRKILRYRSEKALFKEYSTFINKFGRHQASEVRAASIKTFRVYIEEFPMEKYNDERKKRIIKDFVATI